MDYQSIAPETPQRDTLRREQKSRALGAHLSGTVALLAAWIYSRDGSLLRFLATAFLVLLVTEHSLQSDEMAAVRRTQAPVRLLVLCNAASNLLGHWIEQHAPPGSGYVYDGLIGRIVGEERALTAHHTVLAVDVLVLCLQLVLTGDFAETSSQVRVSL